MKKPQLCEMTLTEKIGQLLMFHGNCVGTLDELLEVIEKYQPGTFWLDALPRGEAGSNAGEAFGLDTTSRDGSSYPMAEDKRYAALLNSKVKYPMLFADDSGQGLQARYTDRTRAVAPFSVGAADDEELTYQLYKGVAAENRAAGKRWRWSPVIDMPNRLAGASVGRAYADDMDTMIKHSIATCRAQESEGVVSCVKHFPGANPYGILDSHFVSNYITISLEEWEEAQGLAFKRMIDAGVMSIMLSHKGFPAVDDEKINGKYVGTSISKKITTGLLRERLGFKGVIITDDVQMGGYSSQAPREELIVRTVNAGCDVLLGVKVRDAEIVHEAVADGRIPMWRIDESCQRVLDMKEKIGLFDDEETPYTPPAEAKRMMTEAAEKISERALTLLYDRNNLLPVSKDKIKSVAIVYISHSEGGLKTMETLKAEFEKRGAEAKIYDCIDFDNRDEIFEKDLILYLGWISQHNPMGMPSFHDRRMQSFFHAFTVSNERSIGISLGYPYIHLDSMSGANTFINAYSCDERTLVALARAIYGEIPFVGKSPVDIEPKLRKIYF